MFYSEVIGCLGNTQSLVMKKFIKTFFCLFLICIHVGVEFYPSGKLLAQKYVSEIDFESILNTKPITKYMSHLSSDEKEEIISFLKAIYQTKN